jgi:hypothetical protein
MIITLLAIWSILGLVIGVECIVEEHYGVKNVKLYVFTFLCGPGLWIALGILGLVCLLMYIFEAICHRIIDWLEE